MPENINYSEDILIYPITGNLSDITSSTIVTSKSISIHFLNLTNAYGIAIFDPIENKQIRSDNLQYNKPNYDGTNLIFLGDGIDISVQSFDTFEYTLSTDATNLTFSAYLYDINRSRISNILTKTISLIYSNTLDYIGYILDDTDPNYTLDGTFTNNELLTFPVDSYLEIKHTYGKQSKYVEDTYYNGCQYNTYITPSTSTDFILSLINDYNNTYSILNTIEATLYDSTGAQISAVLNKDIKVKRFQCTIPSIELTSTSTPYSSSFVVSASSANSGAPNCFSNLTYTLGVKFNKYVPDGALQQYQTQPIFYNNAILSELNYTTQTIKSKANYKAIIVPTLLLNSKPAIQDEEELGTLNINDSTISFSDVDNYMVAPCYLVDYDPASIQLKFTSPNIDLYKFTNYKQYILYKTTSNDTTISSPITFNNIIFDSIDINYNHAEGTGTAYEYVDFDNRIVGDDYNGTVYGTDVAYNSEGGYYRPQKSSNWIIERNDGTTQLNQNKLHHYSYYMNLTSCNDREMPFMVYMESNVKIHVYLTGGELDTTGDSTTDFTDSTTDSTIDGTDSTSGIPYIVILDFIVEPGTPYQLRESSTLAMLFSPTVTNHIYIQAVEDTSQSEINVAFQLSPCFNDYIYVKKDSDFLNNQNIVNSIDSIEYALLVADHPYTPKYYGGMSNIRTLTLDYNNVNVIAQNPIATYDKVLNTYGDIALTLSPFIGTPSTTYSTLHMRFYETSNSPSDWTDISSLNVGDIVHVFGFGLNKSYYMEYYITPNDGSVSSTTIEKIKFKTAVGICSAPTVVQDLTNGTWRVTCGSTCRPAYRYVDSSYPNRTFSTIDNITDQYNYSSFNEKVLLNGDTDEYFNVYSASNDSTTYFTNEVGLTAKRVGAQFEFMCIGSVLYTLGNTVITYYSPKVTIAENYPWASLVQPLLYVFTSTTSTKIYRNNYGRYNENGTNPGTPNACIWYRKNGSATWINGGTSYYITVSMNVGDTIEVKQTDLNGYYGQSWSVFGKRQI